MLIVTNRVFRPLLASGILNIVPLFILLARFWATMLSELNKASRSIINLIVTKRNEKYLTVWLLAWFNDLGME